MNHYDDLWYKLSGPETDGSTTPCLSRSPRTTSPRGSDYYKGSPSNMRESWRRPEALSRKSPRFRCIVSKKNYSRCSGNRSTVPFHTGDRSSSTYSSRHYRDGRCTSNH